MYKRLALLIVVLLSLTITRARAQEQPVIGWLYIPALGMAEPLYESEIGADGLHIIPAENAVHLSGTAWLDTTYADMLTNGGGTVTDADYYPAGRIVIAGHNPGVFGAIAGLSVGEVLYLASWPEGAFFEVTGAFPVNVKDTGWLAPTGDQQILTLVLCMGEQRMIIEAVRM